MPLSNSIAYSDSITGTHADYTIDTRDYHSDVMNDIMRRYETRISTSPECYSRTVTMNDLDKIISKIYKIIEEHTPINITEEEFMKIVKDDS